MKECKEKRSFFFFFLSWQVRGGEKPLQVLPFHHLERSHIISTCRTLRGRAMGLYTHPRAHRDAHARSSRLRHTLARHGRLQHMKKHVPPPHPLPAPSLLLWVLLPPCTLHILQRPVVKSHAVTHPDKDGPPPTPRP